MKNRYSFRKLFNDIHLWLGIGSGLILFIVCLTGTLYTFRSEVERMAESSKYEVNAEAGAEKLPVEALVEKTALQTQGTVTSVSIPAGDETYQFSVKKSAEERRGTRYYVDPYTAELKETGESPFSGFFSVIFRLHRWLLMERSVGRVIVGTATLIFIFLLLTGMVLWFPKRIKNIRQGLKIKTSGGWKRMNHDLHNALGFYSFLLLLIMAVTGLCWSFGWYRDGLSTMLGARVFGERAAPVYSQVPAETTESMSPDAFIALANQALPYDGTLRLYLPSKPEDAVTIWKYPAGFLAIDAPDIVEYDQYNGKLLRTDRFSDKPLNVQLASLVHALHMGHVFGLFSKILYFIACLIATSLPVTGTIIWINKLRKKASRKKKKQHEVTQHA